MPGVPSSLIPVLKELYAFRAFSDLEMAKVAAVGEAVDLAKDAQFTIPAREEAPFYMVISGRISIAEDRGRGAIHADPFQYKAGQFFGADWVLYGKNRRLIVTAASPVRLLRISAPDLTELLQVVPHLRDGLLFAAQMQMWLRDKVFNWIGEDESVYLITRKHPFFLLTRLVPPVIGFLGSFLLLRLSTVISVSSVQVVMLWFSLLGLGLTTLWAIWRYIDWGNDYYVVTDQRVVWIEQVLGVYESRREAFLSSIRNKQTRTANWFERRYGYGDILMTVYAGQIVFKNIPEPEEVNHLIDLLLQRTSLQFKKQNVQETQKLILEKIRDVGKIMRDEVEPLPLPPPRPKAGRPLLPTWKDIQAFFHIETRFQQGETITYRTHILFLIAKLFFPVLAQLSVLVLGVIFVLGRLQGQPSYPTLQTTIVLTSSLSLFTVGWILYHFSDWRNDIYQITPDRVVDKEHKPFQEEHIVQAFLNDIISMEIERDNPIEVMLNIGTVVINTGGDQKLTFDNIPNPTMALQDIYNRLHLLKRNQEMAEMRKQADQSALLLATYHLYEESRRGKASDATPNSGES